jgi:predicted amidohydrolase
LTERAPLALAVAQPTADAESHAALVRQSGARVVVFPELSLTGYRYDAAPVSFSSLAPVVDACAEAGAIALVGAVVEGPSIAMLRVDGSGVSVAYRKVFVAEGEQPHFKAGDGPAVIDVDGWRIGLGICFDTCNAEYWETTQALGVDVFAAGVLDTPDELWTQDERISQFRPAGAAVAFASYAGSTGEGYDTCAGGSRIWNADGVVVAQAGPDVNEVATATLSA